MSQTNNFDPYKLSKKIVSGVPVYYKKFPWSPCIHIKIVFNNGALNDPQNKEGLSHFLEHIIFDGSPTLPNKKSVRDWSKKYTLNSFNAWTSFYATVYWCKLLPENIDEVLKGIKDLVFNPFIKEDDVEHERKVIIQESWGRFKNEKFLNYTKEYQKNIFADGSKIQNISSPLGWPETISKITQDDLKNWHKCYGRKNMSIVVVGNINEKIIGKIKKFLENIPEGKKFKNPLEKISKPKSILFKKNSEEIGDPREQAEISITRIWKKEPLKNMGLFGLFQKVYSDILFEKIREEHGLCYSLTFKFTPTKTFSEIYFNVKSEEKNVTKIIEEFWKIILDFQNGLYKDKFEIIKKLAIDNIKSSEFLSGQISSNFVHNLIADEKNIISIKELLQMYQKTKYSDIVKISKKIFDKEYIFTEIILPNK